MMEWIWLPGLVSMDVVVGGASIARVPEVELAASVG